MEVKIAKLEAGARERAAAIFALTDLGGGKRRNLHANEKFFPSCFCNMIFFSVAYQKSYKKKKDKRNRISDSFT